MSVINGSDLFVIDDGGGRRYKCRADEFIQKASNYKTCCMRGGLQYQVPCSRVISDQGMDDDDRFAIERDGTRYSVSYGDMRQILAVTVEINSPTESPNVAALFGSDWSSDKPKILINNSSVGNYRSDIIGLTIPAGFGGSFKLVNKGQIQGGGGSQASGTPNGGNALFIEGGINIILDNQGYIASGGGAGGLPGKGGDGGRGGDGYGGSVNTCGINAECQQACILCGQGKVAACNNFNVACRTCTEFACNLVGAWGVLRTDPTGGGTGGAGGAGGAAPSPGEGAGFARNRTDGGGANGGNPGAGGSGGGGGGAGNGGNGGAGGNSGAGGNGGAAGEYGTSGGSGAPGQDGGPGNPGAAGGAGQLGSGGTGGGNAGYAIIGTSRITFMSTGTIVGPTAD